MKTHTRTLSVLVAGATLIGVASATSVRSQAASASTSLNVTSAVSVNCTIGTAALAFGAYDPVVANAAANLDATGTVTITCTRGAATTIGLNLGSNATGSTRRLFDGASDYLTYEMYSDAGRTTVWGNAGAALVTPAVAPSKAARNFTVYGRVTSNQDVPAGNFADTVTATVNF